MDYFIKKNYGIILDFFLIFFFTFYRVDKNADGRIAEPEVKEVICLT
jgi:hypothetical protein